MSDETSASGGRSSGHCGRGAGDHASIGKRFKHPVRGDGSRAPIEVRLGTQPVRLTGTGMVLLAVRVRCSPGVQAFELDASVSSGSAFGSVTRLAPPAIVPCDGRWNRATIKVAAESGTFTVGRAAYEVSVFGYSPPPDEGDSGASAGGTLWIGPTRVR